MIRIIALSIWLVLFFPGDCLHWLRAADRPQWGQQYTRNMVSDETGLPETFEPGMRNAQTGDIDLPPEGGVKWVARLGDQSYGTPIVAGGKVFVGTNNGVPRDPRMQGDRGVLMCFDEKTGEYLWQLVVPKLEDSRVKWGDWQSIGLTSPPTIDGKRAYLVSNRCEVMCLDVEGMADGNDGPYTDEGRHMAVEDRPPLEPGPGDADIVWFFDMIRQTKAEPHNGANCSILMHGDLLYICTANGVEWTHTRVLNPDAPSLIVLNKKTGELVARDSFGIGPDITHGQWSSPATGPVGGQWLGFYAAGNGYVYAYKMLDPDKLGREPVLLENVWKFNGHPLAQTQDHVEPDHQHDSTSYQVTAMPVLDGQRLYVPLTQEPFHGMRLGWLVCLDVTKTGDVTRSGIVWSYQDIGSTVSTVSVGDGLVYAADFGGRLHCLDAATGRPCWVHDVGGPMWGSTLLADGKIYIGSGKQVFWVLKAGRQLSVISKIRMRDGVFSTPVAANGVLYVMTRKHLYAVGK
ncbi:MAG: PQQ-binding-like beta-propeller repeat protein [Pirellulales bacterium]|nr:PQQ-binding-like beta-propeller repeat protein [Pirellulales bacterium]